MNEPKGLKGKKTVTMTIQVDAKLHEHYVALKKRCVDMHVPWSPNRALEDALGEELRLLKAYLNAVSEAP